MSYRPSARARLSLTHFQRDCPTPGVPQAPRPPPVARGGFAGGRGGFVGGRGGFAAGGGRSAMVYF